MKLRVSHRTRYTYGSPVRDSLNEVRLCPSVSPEQRVLGFQLSVTPPCSVRQQFDFYRNHVHRFEIMGLHSELTVEAVSRMETLPPAPLGSATQVLLSSMHECVQFERCYDFVQPTAYVVLDAEVLALANAIVQSIDFAWDAVLAILQFIHREFRYQPAVTNVHTRTSEALQLRCGVCQDFAHVMIALCRALNVPARYVSGYLYNGPADQLRGAQASHAWVEVFLPGRGWIGVDPTNCQTTDERHIKVAVGRDYADVSPLRGTYRGTSRRALRVDVLVTLDDEPDAVAAGTLSDRAQQ